MKTLCFVLMMIFIVNCSGKIDANIPKPAPAKAEEKLSVDVFSLTYHKVIGNCESLPIAHRQLVFTYIPLKKINDDIFVGSLELILDEASKSYQALYKEFPGAANTDTSLFQTTLTGTFQVVKAATASENDKLILENLGVVTPAISGNKINFFISLESDINKEIVQNEVLGQVRLGTTALITDSCLL